MKAWKSLHCAAIVVAACVPVQHLAAIVNPPFVFKSYGGKCLDFGAPPQVTGSPVFLYGCNGTIAQLVSVMERDASPIGRHEVTLMAGRKAIGIRGSLMEGSALELQDHTGSPNQLFQLDGDSIIVSGRRDLVVKPQAGRAANRTPLILAHRELSTEEFWTISCPGLPGLRPTTGFLRVPEDTDFLSAMRWARWGTVIEIAAGTSINLTNSPTLLIPAGVTIRGDRTGVKPGPELYGLYTQEARMLETAGESVRITGLRLRGPSPDASGDRALTSGIVVHEKFSTIIDHNELFEWTSGAVTVYNLDAVDHPFPRPPNIRVIRNFIHHNQRHDYGYGVDIGNGAFAEIDDNVFVSNRHAITSGGADYSGYRAHNNLVLFATPSYDWNNRVEQDFDMHGTMKKPNPCNYDWCGGTGGEYVEIAGNTFLGGNRYNFRLRGTPTRKVDFHDNILVGSRDDAIKDDIHTGKIVEINNRFEAPNPAGRLGVGDFDGDQTDDLFLATGAAWYYAPGGTAEWRFLSAHREPIDQLLFGDFDGDGRTDVMTVQGSAWLVSWGGTSAWDKINDIAVPIGDLAIGDFNGDRKADVFYANGKEWLVSYGGTAPLDHIDTSSYRIPDVRFGDFNGDGKTDIFGIEGGRWSITRGGTPGWVALPHTLSDSVRNLIVADLNGDGKADLMTLATIFPTGIGYKAWYNGAADWSNLRPFASGASIAGIGRFSGGRGSDILLWNGLYLDISAGGTGAPQRQSRQDMK